MKISLRSCVAALMLTSSISVAAHASVLLSDSSGAGVKHALPDTLSYTFDAPFAGRALTEIDLRGYRSLDGQNKYEDDFFVYLNGIEIYKATFDLGGGGANVVYKSPGGSTFTSTPSTGKATFKGGTADILIPFVLASGENTLRLAYTSVAAPLGAGNQGIRDEAFGVDDIVVSSLVSSVPLPASAPMFGAALIALAAAGFRSNRKAANLAG